jgi:hypothetical protein
VFFSINISAGAVFAPVELRLLPGSKRTSGFFPCFLIPDAALLALKLPRFTRSKLPAFLALFDTLLLIDVTLIDCRSLILSLRLSHGYEHEAKNEA